MKDNFLLFINLLLFRGMSFEVKRVAGPDYFIQLKKT